MIALLLLQAAAAAPVRPAPPQTMSILVDPCAGAVDPQGHDVVVCGRRETIAPRLPLRDERGPPDGPSPSNPEMTGAGALAATAPPCAIHGCYVGFGQPIVAAAVKAIGNGIKDLKDGRARRRDGARRVAIDLDGPPPPIPAGALRP